MQADDQIRIIFFRRQGQRGHIRAHFRRHGVKIPDNQLRRQPELPRARPAAIRANQEIPRLRRNPRQLFARIQRRQDDAARHSSSPRFDDGFHCPSSLREAKNPLQYNKKAGDKQYPTCLLLRGEIRNSAITPARALLPRPRELPRPSPRRRRRIRLRRPDGWTGRCASSRCQRSAPSRGQSDLPARRQ